MTTEAQGSRTGHHKNHGEFGGMASRKVFMTFAISVHRDMNFKWGIAIWEGPIAYRMFVQYNC